MGSEKKLNSAWAKFRKKLEKDGIDLPNLDGGAVYRDSKGDVSRLIYVEDISHIETYKNERLPTDTRSTDEQEAALREKYSEFVNENEMDILVQRFVYNKSFKLMAEEYEFIGGASTAYRMYKRAINKIRKKL